MKKIRGKRERTNYVKGRIANQSPTARLVEAQENRSGLDNEIESRNEKTRKLVNEVADTHASARVRGAMRSGNPTALPEVAGLDAPNPRSPRHSAKMVTHINDFVSSGGRGPRAESARTAFHALRPLSPLRQGDTGICSTPGCTRTTDSGNSQCPGGTCNIVQRPEVKRTPEK